MAQSNLPPVVADALSPTVGTPQGKRQAQVEVKQAARQRQESKHSETSVLVEVPIAPYDSKWPNPRVDVHLDNERSIKLLALLNGLKRDKARLNNDMPVRSNADVLRWILDQIDDSSVAKAENIK